MKLRDYAGRIYRRRFGRWALHILFWMLFFVARYYIGIISLNPFKVYPQWMLLSNLFATLSTAFAYYVLVYLIYEKFFRQKKYVATAAAFIALVIIYTVIDLFFERILMQDTEWLQLVQSTNPEYYEYLKRSYFDILASRILSLGILYQLFINLALPLCIRVMIAYNREQLQAAELAKQNVQLEFNFLKSQVSPHFLHNTLNNIYSLIIHDKKTEAAATVARLSAFMRYSMHDAGMDQVKAEKEIRLMQDYIDLEKIRLNYTEVRPDFEIDKTGYSLPPLLLIPIIENAFKYSRDSRGSIIAIDLSVTDHRLVFQCRNDIDPSVSPGQKNGIGLANVKKRLEQYYPGRHSYTVSTINNVYSVNLSIMLL